MVVRLRPVRVFLVEDSAVLRTRLQAMIEAIPGASLVGHAAGADDAVRGITAEKPDVVVLDLHLAQGNGFDVMRAAAAAALGVAFYVLTNYPMAGYRMSAERLGARGFFDKSSEFMALRDALASRAASEKS